MKNLFFYLAVNFAVLLNIASAAPLNAPTNYWAGYVYVSPATNAGDTGIATNTAYIAIPVASLTDCTTNQAATDVRPVVYGLLQAFYTNREALTSTNRTQSTAGRAANYTTSGTNVIEAVTHSIQSTRTIGTASFP